MNGELKRIYLIGSTPMDDDAIESIVYCGANSGVDFAGRVIYCETINGGNQTAYIDCDEDEIEVVLGIASELYLEAFDGEPKIDNGKWINFIGK